MAAKHSEKRTQSKQGRGIWVWKLCVSLLWAAVILFCFVHRKEISVSEILRFTPSNPVLAAAIILLLFAVKSLTIVLYSGLLYAANGILFPLPVAVGLNLLGTAVMVSIPYLIGRKLGKNIVERVVAKYPKAEQLRELRQENDLFFTFFRYSNARQWDSVCRTWCFSDACWLVHSRDSPLRRVADIPSCDRPYTGIAFPIPLSVLS